MASLPALLASLDAHERVRGRAWGHPFGLRVPQKFRPLEPSPGPRRGPRSTGPPGPPPLGADCCACAAPDATGTPSIDPDRLAVALDDADLTQSALWSHWAACRFTTARPAKPRR